MACPSTCACRRPRHTGLMASTCIMPRLRLAVLGSTTDTFSTSSSTISPSDSPAAALTLDPVAAVLSTATRNHCSSLVPPGAWKPSRDSSTWLQISCEARRLCPVLQGHNGPPS
ncbi:hypothetical protein XPA_010395 [Xanthoria parietina]